MMSAMIIKGCFSSTNSGTTPKPVVTTTPKPQAPTPVPSVNVPKTADAASLIIVPSFAKPKQINQNIISFNTGFMFSSPMEKEPEVAVITKTLSPKVLRFPGGTIGNYYHPDGIGYGMKKEETGNTLSDLVKAQPLFRQNAIYHFADLCKMSNSKVVYVANMLTGNTDEMLWVLDFFNKAGIDVIAVELGNEFYFSDWVRKNNGDFVARFDAVILLYRLTIDMDIAILGGYLNFISGGICHSVQQKFVNPNNFLTRICFETVMFKEVCFLYFNL
jgi:hypothetical protein